MHICASNPCSNQGRWAASSQPTYPQTPWGVSAPFSKEPYRDNTVMRYLTQTLNTSVKRWLGRRLHAGPFTYCNVEILLVDVAPTGLSNSYHWK